MPRVPSGTGPDGSTSSTVGSPARSVSTQPATARSRVNVNKVGLCMAGASAPAVPRAGARNRGAAAVVDERHAPHRHLQPTSAQAVTREQAVEMRAIEPGVAGGGADVAAVALEERAQVRHLEAGG